MQPSNGKLTGTSSNPLTDWNLMFATTCNDFVVAPALGCNLGSFPMQEHPQAKQWIHNSNYNQWMRLILNPAATSC